MSMAKNYRKGIDAWKRLFYGLNEEMAEMNKVNEALIGRCLELELENWRLTREVHGTDSEGASQATAISEAVGDGG